MLLRPARNHIEKLRVPLCVRVELLPLVLHDRPRMVQRFERVEPPMLGVDSLEKTIVLAAPKDYGAVPSRAERQLLFHGADDERRHRPLEAGFIVIVEVIAAACEAKW